MKQCILFLQALIIVETHYKLLLMIQIGRRWAPLSSCGGRRLNFTGPPDSFVKSSSWRHTFRRCVIKWRKEKCDWTSSWKGSNKKMRGWWVHLSASLRSVIFVFLYVHLKLESAPLETGNCSFIWIPKILKTSNCCCYWKRPESP